MTYPIGIQSAALLGNRAHRFAMLWKVDRTDGTTLRFTDHDRALTFAGNIYYPTKGFDASAVQSEMSMRESDFNIRGILSDDKITFNDLKARRYDDAKITEYLVDWRYSSVIGEAIFSSVYYIETTEFDGATWRARITSLAGSKMRKILGYTMTKTCSHELGDAACKVDLEDSANKWSTTVQTIVTPRKVFTVPANAFANKFFSLGKCSFTSGENAGISMTMAHYASATLQVALLYDAPLDIAVGDAITLRAGCNLLKEGDCATKFNNRINFGGYPDAPGTNKATPLKV